MTAFSALNWKRLFNFCDRVISTMTFNSMNSFWNCFQKRTKRGNSCIPASHQKGGRSHDHSGEISVKCQCFALEKLPLYFLRGCFCYPVHSKLIYTFSSPWYGLQLVVLVPPETPTCGHACGLHNCMYIVHMHAHAWHNCIFQSFVHVW